MRHTTIVLLLAVGAAAAPSRKEQGLRDKLAQVWLQHIRYCRNLKLGRDGLESWTHARALDPAFDKDGTLKTYFEAVEDQTGESAVHAGRRANARADAAKIYDKLGKLKIERAEEYRFTAIELLPAKRRTAKVVKRIRSAKSLDDAGRLLTRLRAADPEGKYDSLELDLARRGPVLIRGKGHELLGWLSLPRDWKNGRSYPVMVAVEGAGSNFIGALRASTRKRGKRPWIVLAPCTFVNTNALAPKKYPWYDAALLEKLGNDGAARFAFDSEGLIALLETIKERFGGEEQFAITGFSGGGNLTYGMLFLHPDRIRFAVPACANFGGHGAANAATPKEGGPPVVIYTGANDPHAVWTHGKEGSPGIEPQTDRAVEALKSKGFSNVTRTKLPGVGHSNLHDKVWETADKLEK